MQLLDQLGVDELRERQRMSDVEILTMGISFTIYSDGENIDRAWPFDVIPRLISGQEWEQVSAGLKQRLRALNMFIDDVYNEQRIIAAGIFPGELLEDATNFRQECRGVHPKFGVWAHISGSDLVRAGDGQFYVLEDNLRVPSGVSYVLENRVVAKRAFPELFERHLIRPVDGYTDELNKLLMSLAPEGRRDPNLVVLTPGIFNSAYFEHSFLAQQMGAELVEGADLVVGDDECVYMKTVQGLERVDVIYRRIDDLFLDPEAFNPDSMLGVPGLMRAWKAGNVGIANAPGAGVADDKCVYAWVPDMVRYYLGEEPLIANVPTFRCMYDDERNYVLDHLDQLVLKPANESGGYGIVIGDRASPEVLAAAAESIRSDPRNWVAQPILDLSTAPTLVAEGVAPRHLDLRPFILTGEHSYVTAGGLTRVALNEGSLIVNSSQGGGSKDTWIVDLDDEFSARFTEPQTFLPLLGVQSQSQSQGQSQGQSEPGPDRRARVRVRARAARRAARPPIRRRRPDGAVVAGRRAPVLGRPLPRACRGCVPRAALVRRRARRLPRIGHAVEFARRRRRRRGKDAVDAVPSEESAVVQYLLADREHANSIAVSVERSRENLRTCREVMPREAWVAVNDLSLFVRGAAATSIDRRRRERLLTRVIDDSRRLDGVLQSAMTRDEAFEMWRLGRYIERADMTTRVLGVRAASLLALPAGAHEEFAEVQWMGVLRSLSALQMYQRATRGPINGAAVVRFLLFDHRFPRSVAGCLAEIRASTLRMPSHTTVLGTVESVDRALRRSRPAADDGVALDAAMDGVQLALGRLNDVMYEQYVVH